METGHKANATARARSFLIELAGIFSLGKPRKSIWEPRNHSTGAQRIPLSRSLLSSSLARFPGQRIATLLGA
jgi:hypothetical protein